MANFIKAAKLQFLNLLLFLVFFPTVRLKSSKSKEMYYTVRKHTLMHSTVIQKPLVSIIASVNNL